MAEPNIFQRFNKNGSQVAENVIDLLKRKVYKPPTTVDTTKIDLKSLSPQQLDVIKSLGVVVNDLQKAIEDRTIVNFERMAIYRDAERALIHPLMAAAVALYADYSTNFSTVHGASVWCTTESREYHQQIERLFEVINLEEVIYDWAYTIANFGDHFVKVNAQPGVGIVSIIDTKHPLGVSRVDIDGRLVGFYETPDWYVGGGAGTVDKVLPPWQYVHFRLLGAVKRRPLYPDQQYSFLRTGTLLDTDNRQLTSKYGSGVLNPALPIYKRLRLAEDSVLMARVGKAVKKYIWKVSVDGGSVDAVAAILQQYNTALKRARNIDTGANTSAFGDAQDLLGVMEDVILPVWGGTNNLEVDEIGGDTDIKWIVDLDKLENQLAAALNVPLPILSGFTGDLPSQLSGTTSLDKMDIRFARTSRRLQRAILSGVGRLVQIHLAYQNMRPDLNLFELHMSETSTAEEEEIKRSMDTGADIVDKVATLIMKYVPNINAKKLIDYLNKKVLKIDDLDFEQLLDDAEKLSAQEAEAQNLPQPGAAAGAALPAGTPAPGAETAGPVDANAETPTEEEEKEEEVVWPKESQRIITKNGKRIVEYVTTSRKKSFNGDLSGLLPEQTEKLDEKTQLPALNEKGEKIMETVTNKIWEKQYKGTKIKFEEEDWAKKKAQ